MPATRTTKSSSLPPKPGVRSKTSTSVSLPNVASVEVISSQKTPVAAPSLVSDLEDLAPLSNTEVFDEGDFAQWMQLNEQAEIAHRAKILGAPETHPDFDGVHCVDCDIDIPTVRLNLQKVRCVDCQSLLEEERLRQKRLR